MDPIPLVDSVPTSAADGLRPTALFGHQPVTKYMKQLLSSLADFNPNQWTAELETVADDFLSSATTRKLFGFVDSTGKLVLQPALPTETTDVVYFVRDLDAGDPRISEQSFHDRVYSGSLSGSTLDSLLRLMQGVHLPLVTDNHTWPDKVKKDFTNQFHKFMAFLTDTAFQLKGYTVLYVPNEDLSNVNEIARSKEHVQRLESLLVHWTRQIKEVISNQHTSETSESSGPMDEIQFWKRRCDDLSGISEQLTQANVKQIIAVLAVAKSSYLEQFLRLSNLIQDGSHQAQDNLKFLSILIDPCRELETTSPKNIPKLLPKLLNCIRIIWTHSSFYSSKERITGLLRKLSNEIIRQCTAKISLEDVFHGNVDSSIKNLEESIECGEAWKTIYKNMCQHVLKHTKRPWDFDQSSIFAQIDAFVQRCRDLLEVCEGQMQFARKLRTGTKKAPVPFFGGSRGPEIGKNLEDIEMTFDRHLTNLWSIRKHILDVKATQWHDEYSVFKQGMKDLEVMVQNIIVSAFEDATTVEKYIELLQIFHGLAKREGIKRTVEKKTADLWTLYLRELSAVKTEFDSHRKTPEIVRFHPDFAGSAYWARFLLRRVRQPMEQIQMATFLPHTHLAEEARTQYDAMISSLEEYITKCHQEWSVSPQCKSDAKLNTPLMGRAKNNHLTVTFHKDLSRLFHEVHYWQKMKLDIPFSANESFGKREELRTLVENVLLVVRDYNTIIGTLSQEEQNLFKERIRFLDRKISPGLTNLTWASKGITEFFIKDCRRFSHDVQSIVADFSNANAKIQECCDTIAEMLFCNIEQKKIYELAEFEETQYSFHQKVQDKLRSVHETIRSALSSLFEFFRADGREVQAHWTRFVEQIDNKVEDALRTAVKRSLQEMSKAINGEGKSKEAEVHPLFKVNVVLEGQKVEFSPPLQKLEEEVNNIARNMISCVSAVRRLSDNLGDDNQDASVFHSIAREEDVLKIFVSIQNGMTANWTKCQAYVRTWDSYREIWEINKDAFIRRYAKLKPQMSTFDADINRYNEVANNAQKEETYTNVNFIRLDCSPLKHTVVGHCSTWQNKLTTLLNTIAATELSELHEMFMAKSRVLRNTPTNLDQLSDLVNLLNILQAEIPNTQARFGPIREQYQILEKYEVQIKDSEKLQLESLPLQWTAFLQTVADSEKALVEYKAKFKSELLNSVDEFAKTINVAKEDFLIKGPFGANIPVDDALTQIEELRQQFAGFSSTERVLRKGLTVFKIDQAPSKDLEAIIADLEVLNEAWNLTKDWNDVWKHIKNRPFHLVDIAEIESIADTYQRKIAKVMRNMKDWSVFRTLQDKVALFGRLLPVTKDFKNPSLRDRHWSQFADMIGRIIRPEDDTFCMEKMMEYGLEQYVDLIAGVSASASKELTIELGLKAIETSWRSVDLDIVPYKKGSGYYKLRNVDPVFELLEENQVNLSAMKCSKYFMAFESDINFWENTLTKIIEVIETLLQVQRAWIYLENVFVGAEDIRKQLPRESSSFDEINESWKTLLSRMVTVKNALRATQEPRVLETLSGMLTKLEKIQKSLDTYLETKRQAFPRFYFLSNEDLLEILGQSKDPHAIQPRLRKCFDSLCRLELSTASLDNRQSHRATGMYSLDGEYVPFNQAVVTEGPVETWLYEIEGEMKATLKAILLSSIGAMKKVKRDKWVKEWPGQIVITSSQIGWTSDCVKALHEAEEGDKEALPNLKKKQMSMLKKYADIVREPLTSIEIRKMTALITIEVHARDVLERMIKADCEKLNSFAWNSQLRFYIDKESDECVVKQNNAILKYGYEYLGNSGRLVVTALTDRVYMTLTNALYLNRGASPQGPAGTGKTETIKDLGKAMAKYVLIQNCSESMDYRSMARMFSGIAQSGAWACFDEFNRIDVEVLSVVALQISSIQHALSKKLKLFIFEGQEIRLDSGCGVFITGNPSYAGRVELPDNVKSLFRPITMMVPDSALIAEIILFAAGFSNSKVYAKKVECVHRLAGLQLSKQDHYDFGLRAMTTCLKLAEKKKRQDLELSDELVLYSALKETVVPKLTQADMSVYVGILADLFPGMEMSVSENALLRGVLIQELVSMKLQPEPAFVTKILQLYETKLSRHGVMIIGESGSGKTVAWKALQSALNQLAKTENSVIATVKAWTMNPKSIDLGDLFGEIRANSTEWNDGLFSSTLRTVCADEKRDNKWIVLDGPVDTSWIESMNSLLDDNRVLTLNSGERIALSPQVSLIFEVDNLANASPATVSRCGMTFFDRMDLGWKPVIDSWIQAHGNGVEAKILRRLCEKYVPQALAFRKDMQETVGVSELGVIKMLCNLYNAVATRENGVDPADTESYTKMIELWFLFAIIWAIGGPLNEESRKKFDMFLRELEGQFPSKDTVFEYSVDKQNKAWVSWEERLPANWRIGNNTPFSKIYVPTIESVRFEFIVKAMIAAKYPLLLVGEAASGKTTMLRSILSSADATSMTIALNSRSTPSFIQTALESHLEKRTKNIYAPTGGKTLVSFVDDLNLPAKDRFGSQSAIEFLRYFIEYGQTYDKQKRTVKIVEDVLIFGAMSAASNNPRAKGKYDRILSRFSILNHGVPRDASLLKIFRTIINQKLQDFEEDIKPCGDLIAVASLDILKIVSKNLLPTPAKMHYVFTIRDVAKVFQGLLLANREYYDSRETILKLWVHEMQRVFADKLTTGADRNWFTNQVDSKLADTFDSNLAELFQQKPLSIFSDCSNETGVYQEVVDINALRVFLESKLEEYNTKNTALKLILFEDAIGHLCRIVRVLRLARGHALLVGIGGSGRQSLARISAYICGMTWSPIKFTKSMKLGDFHDQLKHVYSESGLKDKVQVVHINLDAVLMQREGVMEEIATLTSGGEPPHFYAPEEISEIRESMRLKNKDMVILEGQDNFMERFFENVRDRVHLILSISPHGVFRDLLRMFPVIFNHSSMDWFSEWPEDALLEVASKKLHQSPIEDADLRKAVAKAFVAIHRSVIEQSVRLEQELRRYNYVTPTSFLEFVDGFQQVYRLKQKEFGEAALKLKNGLGKLDETRENVERISAELEVSKARIVQFQKQCEEYLVVIVQQKREADEQAKVVTAKSEKLQVEEEEVRAIAKIAEEDLAQAMPIFEAATKSLELLSKKDLQEIKSYGKPPPLVEKVLEAVMVLKKCEPTWEESKRQLGNPNFIKQLINYDKDNMSDKILKRISQYCADEQFQPDVVGKVSTAARSLCMWVRAMETYGHIFRQIAPKREKLLSANEALAKKQAVLKESQQKLQEVKNKLADLTCQYEEKLAYKENLRVQIEETEQKLGRAEQLVSGLSGEKSRWEASILVYDESLRLLVGDSIVGSAFMSYAGPFNSVYRNRLICDIWMPLLVNLSIPFSPGLVLSDFCGSAPEIRHWSMNGLPTDLYSAENGIIVTKSNRWPLLIDPQGQASRWIKNIEKTRNIKIVDLKQPDYMRTLENAISFGIPVLLSGLTETIDPNLDAILAKNIIKRAGQTYLLLGEKEIDFSSDFRLYLATKLPNPHFAPEVFSKATVVNFTVKEKGLEDQLLGLIVRKERPELEEQKDILVVDVASQKEKIKELEDEILGLLSKAQGSLLDDEKLVNALNTSKSTSEDISIKLKVTEQNEKKIDIAREGYRPCAQRGMLLYFVINEFSLIDPMYQFSLDWYIGVFMRSISNSKKADDIVERLNNINDHHTLSLYRNVCRGLFEDHKLIFSFQIATKILATAGKLNDAEFDFFLRGGLVLDRDAQLPNPAGEWVTETSWDNLTSLDALPVFVGIASSLGQNERDWKQWYTSDEPEEMAFPGEWENKLNSFQKLLVIRSLRPDRVIHCVRKFVLVNLGQKFVESFLLDYEDIFADSSPTVPVVFVLSSGVDPLDPLRQLAVRKGMDERLKYVSLGQGQAGKAARMIQEGMRDGDWVFLANCHYSISWMSELEKTVERMQVEKAHKDFRLWLSCMPDDRFPISILQASVKVTNEPPSGLKANINRLVADMKEESFEICKDVHTYRRLYLSLCTFHSLVLERRKFLMLGWNNTYDFNDSDFEFSNRILVNLLNEFSDIPWDALRYLIADVTYAGRIIDDWDRRVLKSYMADTMNENVLLSKDYHYCSNPNYTIPECPNYHSIREFINALPLFDRPEVFGQHTNAIVMKQISDSLRMTETLQLTRPQTASVTTGKDQKVLMITSDMLKALPDPIDYSKAATLFSQNMTPIRIAVLQEIARYNDVISVIFSSLQSLESAIRGTTLITTDLELLSNSIFEGKIPRIWQKTFPSTKPLGFWFRDLCARVEYFRSWAISGDSSTVQLGYFTQPSGFLSAALQNYARKSGVAVDILSFETSVVQLDEDGHMIGDLSDGILLTGLTLEGAGWDRKNNCLKEPKPMELSVAMPPILLKPFQGKRRALKGFYLCPVYMYPVRAAMNNRISFVVAVDLRVGLADSEFWVKRGTALLCSLG